MRRRAGAVPVAVLAGGLLLVPAVATAAPGGDRLRTALQSLADDGTLTAAQRDAVVTRLAEERPGGEREHRGLGARARRRPAGRGGSAGHGAAGGRARAARRPLDPDVAREKQVLVTQVVDALVADAERRLAAAVTAGRLTQAEADARRPDLRPRLTAAVERPGGGKGKDRDKGKQPD